MPNKSCIELSKLVGFYLRKTEAGRWILVDPNGNDVGGISQYEDFSWRHSPNYLAPHDGLALLSRWVWPYLWEKDLWWEAYNNWFFKQKPSNSRRFKDWLDDLPGQVTAAISVLKEVKGD